ncbi:hypothetical protein [Massilia sp. BKSP1R2A-1]|uniref:hypothetical protein n=1 Tax=Massilia sp. BKSP1R2A-1 TaxID=3422595 RepID=UPI003D32A97C
MHQQAKQDALASLGRWTAIGLAAAILSACGGGGGSPGGTGPNTGGGGTSNPVPADPKISIALTDANGANVSLLSGSQSATVKATVLTAAGKPASGVIVQFATSAATLLAFTPETASALTDANGVATITVRPASASSAGALSITATSVVESKTVTASTNFTVGAAPLTVGALAFSPAPTGRLPAFSTASLSIPVTSGGQPASAVSGLNLTSLCVADGTATLVPGAFANGVQAATYTNNGCMRGRDVITVSIGNSVQTISLDVDPANIGAIQFTSSGATGNSIVLKGSGGQGRSEAAQLTFKVVDQQGNGLAGVEVNFSATTNTGGLTVSPNRAVTDAGGNVSTMVSSGTIPTPVRVMAEATRNGSKISGLSDTLTVSTGLPIQKSMSMSAEVYNIEGMDRDGISTDITVMMADQYGNPVSDNTAVNFVTEGGAIGSAAQGACLTKDGACTVQLRSQAFKPLDGRVTVMAYAQGIENFVDLNGDGQYTCSGWTGPAAYRPLVDTCPGGGEPFPAASSGQEGDMGDPFLDTDRNGVYDAAKGDLPIPYNSSTYKAGGDGKWGLNYIRRSIEIVFSGSHPRLIRQFYTGSAWRDWNATTDGDPLVLKGVNGSTCSAVDLRFRLTDNGNNPMPQGTLLTTSDVSKVTVSSVTPSSIPNTTAVGGTLHNMTVSPDVACSTDGGFILNVKPPRGDISLYKFSYK